jgi:hypothetical protein
MEVMMTGIVRIDVLRVGCVRCHATALAHSWNMPHCNRVASAGDNSTLCKGYRLSSRLGKKFQF